MSDAYLGEIRMFAGNFAPKGWAFCNGQILAISQNTALFSLLGTNYGGNGMTTFGLPNLMGRAPMHQGSGNGLTPRTIGEMDGSSTVTLLTAQIPNHSHVAQSCSTPNSTSPIGAMWSSTSPRSGAAAYAATSDGTTLNPMDIQPVGNSMPHNNRQPYLGINFIICLGGIFPPRG